MYKLQAEISYNIFHMVFRMRILNLITTLRACCRKSAVPRWTKQVQISPGTGLEGPLDDGFSWRKYGQKDILGAKYPRYKYYIQVLLCMD